MNFVWAADWHAQKAHTFEVWWFFSLILYPLSMANSDDQGNFFYYKFRFYISIMYEICLHCHLLTFSWFRMNYGQFVIHVLTLSPIIDILHVNSKRMKIFLDYFHFLHEYYLILNPAGENFWTQLALLHINSSYFHKKRKERERRLHITNKEIVL